jgi:hypothetical protein
MYIVYYTYYTVYSIQYTVYSILNTVYCIQHTAYSIQYTVYIIQYTVYSIQYTVYSIHNAGEDCGAAHGGQRGKPQAAPDPRQQEAHGRQGGADHLIFSVLKLYVIIEGWRFPSFPLFWFRRAILEG